MIKSVYIHIPFCNKICSYCDFCKMFYNKNLVNKYLEELEKEINNTYKNEVLDTIYIGGGTPSSLDIEELTKLFSITDKFIKSKNIEFTIECNFDSITKDKIDLFIKHGINRISFGLETTNKKFEEYLNRNIDLNKVEEIISYCKEKKLLNINIDLIYALKNQTINDLEKDLNYIIKLDVAHISIYSLIIEDNTLLAINNEKNISEDLDYEMYKYIYNYLNKFNYIHYEISNYSKDGYQSKHNSCYWNNDKYYGFGLGASSYIDNKRITNTRSITKYLEGLYVKDVEDIDIKADIEYEIILNLRKREGINLNKFKTKFNKELRELYNYDDLIKQELLVCIDNHLLIPEDKWYISNEIIVKILGSEIDG